MKTFLHFYSVRIRNSGKKRTSLHEKKTGQHQWPICLCGCPHGADSLPPIHMHPPDPGPSHSLCKHHKWMAPKTNTHCMYCVVLYSSIYIVFLNSHGQTQTLLVRIAPRKETSFKN